VWAGLGYYCGGCSRARWGAAARLTRPASRSPNRSERAPPSSPRMSLTRRDLRGLEHRHVVLELGARPGQNHRAARPSGGGRRSPAVRRPGRATGLSGTPPRSRVIGRPHRINVGLRPHPDARPAHFRAEVEARRDGRRDSRVRPRAHRPVRLRRSDIDAIGALPYVKWPTSTCGDSRSHHRCGGRRNPSLRRSCRWPPAGPSRSSWGDSPEASALWTAIMSAAR
jgi:hypothetical protein